MPGAPHVIRSGERWKLRGRSERIVVRVDESRLIELARGGDRGAMERLFEQAWPLAWHWAYGITGDRMLADHVGSLVDALRRPPGVHVVFVHVAHANDKLWTTSLPDPNYHADPGSGAFVERVAASLRGAAYSDGDLGAVAAAVRRSLGPGRATTVTEPARRALMPYVTLAAFVPLAFLLWRRNV
jgi:hypothetical protein